MFRALRHEPATFAWLALGLGMLPVARGDEPKPPDHPVVAAFERFSAGPNFDAIRGGLTLLGELNCTSCHAPESSAQAHISTKKAPILDAVGNRVKVPYLRAYLSDPAHAKPGTTMPHALGGLEGPARAEAVEALVNFLASTGSTRDTAADRRSIGLGRQTYRQVGCIACHGARETATTLPTSVPLPDLPSKYTMTSLGGFLSDPSKVRPSGRMPSLNLDSKEAAAVAAYLLKDQVAEIKPNVNYQVFEGNGRKCPTSRP